jgi:hypothetical protein
MGTSPPGVTPATSKVSAPMGNVTPAGGAAGGVVSPNCRNVVPLGASTTRLPWPATGIDATWGWVRSGTLSPLASPPPGPASSTLSGVPSPSESTATMMSRPLCRLLPAFSSSSAATSPTTVMSPVPLGRTVNENVAMAPMVSSGTTQLATPCETVHPGGADTTVSRPPRPTLPVVTRPSAEPELVTT